MSSRPALADGAPAAEAPAPELSLAAPPAERARRLLAPGALLAGLFVLAAAYHALQSRSHLTPAIFTDELLYSKLAQSIAAGKGLVVRGEPVFFPAPLPALVQAPAWLVSDTPTAYALIKVVNAVLMTAAAFPAYLLARRLVRPSFALLTAAATVAAPALLYHSYLMSEALAYPVFLLALATMMGALARPSLRSELAVVGVSLLAVSTRVQFVSLPLAFLLAAPLAARLAGDSTRAALRRHALSVGALTSLGALVLASGGAALGPYLGVAGLAYSPGQVLRWAALSGALLAFGVGWLVAPGAVCGLACLLARPRSRAEAAFGVLAGALCLITLLQIGLVAAGEAERPLERYAIYLLPLFFLAFFAYVERGAPRRWAYVGLALVAGLLAWLAPFPSLAGFRFSYDSPTLSAYGVLAFWVGHANAATVFSGGAFFGSLLLAAVPLRRRAASALGAASVGVLLLTGIAVYSGDHAMTRWTLRAFAGAPVNWLDRSGLGRIDYVALPYSTPHFGWVTEAWNRDFGRLVLLGWRGQDRFKDSFPIETAHVDRDGLLLVDGRPLPAGGLALNDFGTTVELEGTRVARPAAGLSLYRIGPSPRLRSLAVGLFFDRWAAGVVRYQVWPRKHASSGLYRVRIELPAGYEARRVVLAVDGGAHRTVRLAPGGRSLVELPARGDPVPQLRIRTDRLDLIDRVTANPRLVAVRLQVLEYVPTR